MNTPSRSRALAVLGLLVSGCIPFGDFIPGERCGHGDPLAVDPGFPEACRASVAAKVEAETVYDAFVAMRGDKLLVRWGQVDRPTNLASVRKSVISVLYGIAAERGLIDLDATLEQLGIDDAPQPLTPEEKKATVRDLLGSRSGIYLPTLGESSSWAERRPARGSHAPGTFWFYNNWDFNALGTIFEQTTNLTIGQAIAEWLAEPLGMQSFCPSHVTYQYADFTEHPMWRVYMSAEDLARLGALMLQDGVWNGVQVVPSAWIAESTAAISETDVELGASFFQYGYLWWLEPGTDRFWAIGSGGQFLIVDRAAGLVTVARNNTGVSIPGTLWYQIGQADDEARASEMRALSVHEEVLSCDGW